MGDLRFKIYFPLTPRHYLDSMTYEIRAAVGELLEKLSTELGLRIELEAKALIEEMTRAGELDLSMFSQYVSTLIESLRESLPNANYSASLEAFEDPEVEGWRALVIRFEIDSTNFNEIDGIWDRLIEIPGEIFGECDRRIYISVRPRLMRAAI